VKSGVVVIVPGKKKKGKKKKCCMICYFYNDTSISICPLQQTLFFRISYCCLVTHEALFVFS